MPLAAIDEREALLTMRIAQRDAQAEAPVCTTHVNGREAQWQEKHHLAAGIRRERAQGAAVVAGLVLDAEL